MLDRLNQLYRYRVLVEVLVLRELKARYRGTLLGLLWSFINPLALVVIYTVVFSIYLKSSQKNFPVFLLAGLLPWNFFVAGLNEGTSSILSSSGIIKKVYLPSEVFPLVSVLSNAIHYLLSIPVLVAVILALGNPIGPAWAYFPVILALQIVFTYGVVLITSAVAVAYRDLLHILPNVIMVGFFLTPIFYPPTTVPERFRFLLTINPMSDFVMLHHSIFYEAVAPNTVTLARAALFAVATLAAGLTVFDRRREYFAESI